MPMSQIFPILNEVIQNGGAFHLTTAGISMLPMLRDRKDTVVLVKPSLPLKKYDVALYKRADGTFVLHRVVGFDKNGYIFCGDNQYVFEHGITDENIIAVTKSYIKAGKTIPCNSFSYKCYCLWHCKTRKIRHLILRVKSKLIKLLFSK